MSKKRVLLGSLAFTAALAACDDIDDFANEITAPDMRIQCDASNAGLTLPAGFCAIVVADLKSGTEAALARHLVVTPNGDVFVAINSPRNANPPFGILGLRDTDGDGRADQQTQFSANLGGSGLAWNNGVLYFGANDRVMRFQLPSGQLNVSGSGFNCASYNQPLTTFGAHWAPNGMTFYTGSQFPLKYRNGAFVAFHGGFDRAPLPNEGYQVMFVPMNASGEVAGTPEAFADGFAGSTGALPATALHRPVGVTEGPDGSLYVSDDRGGRIYRIIYRGQ